MNPTAQTTTRAERDLATWVIPAIAVACFSVHVALLVASGTSMLTMSVAMLVLSGLCVACTWRGSTHGRQDYSGAAVVALTMIMVHLLLMPSGGGDHGMDHTAMDQAGMGHAGMQAAPSWDGLLSSGAVEGLMNAGLALAAMQVVLASAAALRSRRRSIA